MKIIGVILAVLLAPLPQVWAQARKPASLPELASYTGADREKILLSGAQAEGKVVWYTSLAGSSYKEILKAFEARYPGVRVEVYRGTSKDLTARILAEVQAKRFLMDALETTLPLLKLMRENNMMTPFNSPHLSAYPEEGKQKTDKGRFLWGIDRESYIGFAFNKNSVPAGAVPKSYGDLLRPELKGKMGLATSDTGPRAIGGMIAVKGEEFVKKLKSQEITLHTVSGRAMVDLVASGEVGASPTVFRSHAGEVSGAGAPVTWVPMEIVPTNAGGVALPARAPHPHAAVLFVDFLLGPEAQKILERLQYGSATKDYGFKRWYPEQGMDSEQYEKANDKWERLLREIGRKAS
ncbi:MAG: extracellular solute-binding protein [Deltaproteobacteria bacterium]|nr:extracellular solute-binding protein [Deltaproteobacteria bacterium]